MPSVPTKGIAVAFANTPQANADFFFLDPNETVLDFDVMLNDMGGNGKSLYSLDDGDVLSDLLLQDAEATPELSDMGNHISIVDGKAHYELSAGTIAALANLGEDESLVDSFTYAIQMGNGALSHETVTVNLAGTHVDSELLLNWSFEVDQTTEGGGWASFATIPSWTTEGGSAPLEVVSAGHMDVYGDGHWLDSQASPGPINISQGVDVITGHDAVLSLSVTYRDFQDPAERLLVTFNGATIFDISQDDIVTEKTFQTFSANVVGVAGMDLVGIQSVDSVGSFGFSIDWVSLIG